MTLDLINVYEHLYPSPRTLFLLKDNNIYIYSDRMINRDKTIIETTHELEDHYKHIELAYYPNAYEIMSFFILYGIEIKLNYKDEKWEWIIVKHKEPCSFETVCERPVERTIYSGEIAQGGIGLNLPENRQYFETMDEAFDDALSEMIIIL